MLDIKTLSLGELGTNCYIVSKNKEALIIDPGGEANRINHYLNQENIRPIAILLTHAHFDHIGAVDQLREKYHTPVYLHSAEKDWLMDPKLNSSSYFPLGEIIVKPADHFFEIGKMSLGEFNFDVLHTPGHSPGGVSFVFNELTTVISGDCLFQGGIGRTDLVGGDQLTLIQSIKKLYQLPDKYSVLSGHGPETTIAYEKKYNPFVKG